MGLILLEALAALGLLLFLVWWTMFSGRGKDPAGQESDVPGQPGQSADKPDPPAGGDHTDRT